ncbi:MAG: hypothetical protein AB7F19_06060 [Candidatus Babeliales bacterium]
MLTSIIKKIVMFAFIMGIVAPITAMDSHQDSRWFGWKSATGATALVVGLGAWWLYTHWNKSVSKRNSTTKSTRAATKPSKRQVSPNAKTQSVQDSSPMVTTAQAPIMAYEDITDEYLDREIAQLEREIAEDKARENKGK